MAELDVIGVGALNIDRIYRVEKVLLNGETTIRSHTLSGGGSAANTIYGLTKLGLKTGFAGVVGNDSEGQFLLDEFKKIGTDTSRIKVKKASTGAVLAVSDAVHRSLYVLPGANDLLEFRDVDKGYLNQAHIVHISSFAGKEQLAVQKKIVAGIYKRVSLSFSPGALYCRLGLAGLKTIIKRTDIMFLNLDELRQLTGRRDPRKGAKDCLEAGCKTVVVTLGGTPENRISRYYGAKKGLICHIFTGDRDYPLTKKVEMDLSVREATGAGDAFAAGFLFGLLKKKDLETCGYLGDLAARFSLTAAGARAGLPSLPQLTREYTKFYKQSL